MPWPAQHLAQTSVLDKETSPWVQARPYFLARSIRLHSRVSQAPKFHLRASHCGGRKPSRRRCSRMATEWLSTRRLGGPILDHSHPKITARHHHQPEPQHLPGPSQRRGMGKQIVAGRRCSGVVEAPLDPPLKRKRPLSRCTSVSRTIQVTAQSCGAG